MIDITTVEGYDDFVKNHKDFLVVLPEHSAEHAKSYIIENSNHKVIANIDDSVRKYLINRK
ncbi:uncharacterized protein KNAG_0H00900 [Huiozyma naganishii CBS 8797]|uniref:Uncharacterized protein n=1 Tax=Huiozyma naganishii (strain ATCC MYA-139 / BCRC 22969 / CBS 8797 / KCTC 17520 / NBRC 10181 / NCYC 3082 / Yp74L-3) TaxID=1071383 RepID=J7R9H8_HUIN7|nr:hypothetical protein KNAG_0H00900 [Kazachstania naganishii CBS 8797]CCK71505.1 hypothetical protein KNAG_0H00900 [Kazachstania naganishii CBS 8797]